jgi:ankyrin repeat protein
LDWGAQVDAQGGYHGSALIGAAQHGNLEILKLLVNAKANLDLHRICGTALAVARDEHHEDVVQGLLAAGATEWRPSEQDLDRQFRFRLWDKIFDISCSTGESVCVQLSYYSSRNELINQMLIIFVTVPIEVIM